MNKTILVTGGAGFIGSHLCEQLSKDASNRVVSLDNYSTGSENNHVSNVEYIKGNTKEIHSLITFSPDIVFHLGEYSRVEQSFDELEKVWDYNKSGTFEVLQFCRKHACKIVYAGSSTKFGDGGLGRSQSPYGWTKASNTELVKNFGDWFGVPHVIVYFYNVYGPREIRTGRYATLIALFAEKMRRGESLTVVSPGEQKRNFTHVNDIIRALVIIGEQGHGDEFGIGSSESFSILEIAKMFGGNIQMLPERRGNRMTADVMTGKTQALGWSPQHSVSDYIKELRNISWAETY
jgi:UDP-glucose 4-epimerase